MAGAGLYLVPVVLYQAEMITIASVDLYTSFFQISLRRRSCKVEIRFNKKNGILGIEPVISCFFLEE